MPLDDHELGQRVATNFADGDILALTHSGDYSTEVAAVVASDAPDPRGLVVFFTGLSGSGKSTIARALLDVVLDLLELAINVLLVAQLPERLTRLFKTAVCNQPTR